MAEQLELLLVDPQDLPLSDIRSFVWNMTKKLPSVEPSIDPFGLFVPLEIWCDKQNILPNARIPRFDFSLQVVGRKRRHIGAPNDSARMLHKLFRGWLQKACLAHEKLGRFLVPASATAFTPGSSPLKNVTTHLSSQYFYTVDLKDAYSSIDTGLIALILTAIVRYDDYQEDFNDFLWQASFSGHNKNTLEKVALDPLYLRMQKFVDTFCRDANGRGLITGGPISPFLFNLFYEAVLDSALRRICAKLLRKVRYTRYADDLVFSRTTQPIFSAIRMEIRNVIATSGIVNHRKSRVLDRRNGVVFITGFGISPEGKVVFPQKKRTRLRGMLRTAFRRPHEANVSVISGHVAHFREYLRVVQPTPGDKRLLALIQKFEKCFI